MAQAPSLKKKKKKKKMCHFNLNFVLNVKWVWFGKMRVWSGKSGCGLMYFRVYLKAILGSCFGNECDR